MKRIISFADAINEALHIAMTIDKNVICYGLGVDDPKRIFGTTKGLKEKFGGNRVFDMPTSENAMTGVGIGACLNGIRPVMVHQRLDFLFVAMDQIVNNAAKWFYMYGGKSSVPITIRACIGRGWRQGPTHSQNLQALFAHIPGLKVVAPTSAYDAKGLLLESIFDDNPVIFLEHRWLHNIEGHVPKKDFRVPLGVGEKRNTGDDITIVSSSYMTIEALLAIKFLNEHNITCDLIDLRSLSPLDWDIIMTSVLKTGRMLVLDTGYKTGSIAGEIIARVSMECFDELKAAPVRIALPDLPTPTSIALTKTYYPRAEDIVSAIKKMFKIDINIEGLEKQRDFPHDVPGDWFKGPF
ncbi:MAG: alpha-ketoacid dehydrogenase subunit beta [Desulfobacula sp.]|nr:alpha-ketoacid dehydrogenase subunit beta [Desulfobacula sp.]